VGRNYPKKTQVQKAEVWPKKVNWRREKGDKGSHRHTLNSQGNWPGCAGLHSSKLFGL